MSGFKNIFQKSFKLFLLPFVNHLLQSCENYNWQCLSSLYCYKKDFWKSKGCINHFTVQPLDFGWCWLQCFKVLSLCHEDGGESKYVLKYIKWFLVAIFVSFITRYRDRGNFGTQSDQYRTTAVAWQDFCYKSVIFRGISDRDSPADVQVRCHVTNQDYEAKSPEAIALPVLSGMEDFRHLHYLISTFYLENTQVQELGEIFFLRNSQQPVLNKNFANPFYFFFLF